ncbi:hypothetical protein [Hydrogenovibrio sp. JE_KL2]|uniref:hypothetical protein n=1 Tax=Hydrogenovibrio sp. JE_KL2 TaxID=2651188 RepID=UPI00128C2BC6|nr:hypothetical protein [Hydrogenovibrio sp. JE_KL2]MPQ77147.1 hypothetical protein [Hydrogenovibrio sp. JE_KL2]
MPYEVSSNRVDIVYDFNDGKPQATLKVNDKTLLNNHARLTVISRFYETQETFVGHPKKSKEWCNVELFSANIELINEMVVDLNFSSFIPYDYDHNLSSPGFFAGNFICKTEFKLEVGSPWQPDIIKLYPIPSVLTTKPHPSHLTPQDKFDFWLNVRKLQPTAKRLAYLWAGLAITLATMLQIIGYHDQFCAPDHTWLFHRGARSFLFPVVAGIGGSYLFYHFLYKLAKTYLRDYLTQIKIHWPKRVKKDSTLYLKNLLQGKLVSDIDHLQIRVIASNMQHAVIEGGRSRKRVSYPCNEVILFDKIFHDIKAGDQLSDIIDIDDKLHMKDVFTTCFPNAVYGRFYKMALIWQIQIIHDDLVDHLFNGPSDLFEITDFEVLQPLRFGKTLSRRTGSNKLSA